MDRVIVHVLENTWGVDFNADGTPRPRSFFEAGKEYLVSKTAKRNNDSASLEPSLHSALPKAVRRS